MAASNITRVTGVHFYAQRLLGNFLMRSGANDICLPNAKETKLPFRPIRMPR
jgi:hypothetical protein